MLNERATFLSASKCLYLAEEFAVYGEANMLLQARSSLCIFSITDISKTLIRLTEQLTLVSLTQEAGYRNMKTLRITDDVHQKLTALLGELTAQTSRMQTYTDAVEALLKQSVILPPELLAQIESFIEAHKNLGYMTREEFIRDATRWRLKTLTDQYEYIEIRKDEYERLEAAIKEMTLPLYGVEDYVNQQIRTALEKYDEWQQHRDEQERRRRRS